MKYIYVDFFPFFGKRRFQHKQKSRRDDRTVTFQSKFVRPIFEIDRKIFGFEIRQ